MEMKYLAAHLTEVITLLKPIIQQWKDKSSSSYLIETINLSQCCESIINYLKKFDYFQDFICEETSLHLIIFFSHLRYLFESVKGFTLRYRHSRLSDEEQKTNQEVMDRSIALSFACVKRRFIHF